MKSTIGRGAHCTAIHLAANPILDLRNLTHTTYWRLESLRYDQERADKMKTPAASAAGA